MLPTVRHVKQFQEEMCALALFVSIIKILQLFIEIGSGEIHIYLQNDQNVGFHNVFRSDLCVSVWVHQIVQCTRELRLKSNYGHRFVT